MTTAAELIAAAQPQSSATGRTTAADLLRGAGFTDAQIAQPWAPNRQGPLRAARGDQATPTQPSTAFQRFKTGLADVPVGLTQWATHLMPEPTVSPQERAAYGVGPDEKLESFDAVVADREKAYQAGRAAAGSTGFDWTRTAGNAANPINYVVPGGGGAGVVGRVARAGLQGAGVGALNPVSEPGNFWGGKVWQAGVGATVGTLLGGTVEALSRPLSWAAKGLKNVFGSSPPQAEVAAQGAIDQTLQTAGLKTTDLPPEMVDGMRDQVRHAIETGGTVEPTSLRAQAEAGSLPIPIKLPRGQASGDPAQYAAEQELAKIRETGAPLQQLFTENNQKLIDNLDALGAKGAPTAAEAGTQGLTTLARMDQQLDAAKNTAYNAVRDSQGRSATLDAEHFFMNAQSALERDNVQNFLPANLGKVYDDITEGKLPLNVDTMISFDKMLSRAQRTTEDGNATHAIGLVRSALADTPVSGSAGQGAIAAYTKARALARAQFELADPKSQNFIPGYASMLKGMGDASHDEFIAALQGGTANLDPEKWFTQSVMKAIPAATKKLMGFLNQGGDAAQPTVQALQHGVMGEIRDSVVKGNDAVGRAVFANGAMRDVMDRATTLREILPGDTVDALGRLYNTSSRISGVPYKAAVNWSNTAATNVNLQTLKNLGKTVTGAVVSNLPGGNLLMAAGRKIADIRTATAASQATQAATQPLFAMPGSAGTAANRAARVASRGGIPLATLLATRPQASEQ